MVLDHVPKLLAVAGATARIRIQHDVTLRRHPLELVVENKSVSGVGPAVDIQNERILFRFVEARRPLQPGLDRFSIETLVSNFFRISQIELAKEFVVAVSQLPSFTAHPIEPEEVADSRRR